MAEGRTIRRPRRPALFWGTAIGCLLIAAGSIAVMNGRAGASGRAEAAVER